MAGKVKYSAGDRVFAKVGMDRDVNCDKDRDMDRVMDRDMPWVPYTPVCR